MTAVQEAVRILPDLSAEQRRIAELEAMVAALKAGAKRKATLKVSQKGAVSLYGFGQWPVTLYASQWTKVLGMAEDITAFIEAHKSELSFKD